MRQKKIYNYRNYFNITLLYLLKSLSSYVKNLIYFLFVFSNFKSSNTGKVKKIKDCSKEIISSIYLKFIIDFFQYLKLVNMLNFSIYYSEAGIEESNDIAFGSFFNIFGIDCLIQGKRNKYLKKNKLILKIQFFCHQMYILLLYFILFFHILLP